MSKLNPKAILIDLDGTLANSLSIMKLSYYAFLKQFNRNPTDEEFNSLNGPPLQNVITQIKKNHALNESVDELLKKYFTIIDNMYLSVQPNNGAINLLQKAKSNGCTIGVVTSNTKQRTQTWVRNVCIDHMINFIVSSDDVKKGKPNPEPYITATKKTSFTLDQIIAIEDSLQGAQSAISAGLKTFVIGSENTWDYWLPAAEKQSSLSEIADKLY